jgi:hypothetical protein
MMRKVLILASLFLGSFLFKANAQTEIARAQAMFIYNFSRLIEWPADYKNGPFVIGVLGNSSIQEQLKVYTTGKSVGSQPITVKTFNSPSDVSTCHILFVPFAGTKQMPDLLQNLQGKSTLIISEKNGAIEEGSAINFVIVGDKLKFELSTGNATKYNIKISSKLNEMAFKIY